MNYSVIKHVVIIFKENHTFDNYFAEFPGANGTAGLRQASNPPWRDHLHGHFAWLHRHLWPVKQQYTKEDIPYYYALAHAYTLCDNYFTDVAGPSTPNHLMAIAADSPVISNPHWYDIGIPRPPFALPSLPEQLEKAGLSWRNYGGYAQKYIKHLADSPFTVPSEQFVKDAQRGELPAVSWVYAPAGATEHPISSITRGEEWTKQQIEAVMTGNLFQNTAIFITWDDWGGWFDHVTPPAVEQWTDGSQFRYGSRVACLVVSPYAKRGYISHQLNSHISLLKFAQTVFSLPSLNTRNAEANAMLDCFDFNTIV